MNDSILSAIKKAMKAEADSVAVYETAMENAEAREVKDFFYDLADQERQHYNWLLSYYKELQAGRASLTDLSVGVAHEGVNPSIMTKPFLAAIGTNPRLFAAISASLLMEENAARFYAECAESTPIEELASFFSRLSDWEHNHYHDLLKVQEEAERHYWDANRFEPF